MTVEGTSNLHDWDLTVEDMNGSLDLVKEGNSLKTIDKLHLTIPAESLKSGKRGMDKNTFKALDTDDHETISYHLKTVKNVNGKGGGSYTISTTGDLSLAGETRSIAITFDAKMDSGKLTLSGSQEIDMTDYKIDPPTALFGTITTGKEVTIIFRTTFTQ